MVDDDLLLKKGSIVKYKYTDKKYAKVSIENKSFLLHRYIMGVTDPKIFVDHKDGNGLNNQRSNLRICNRNQNGFNRGSDKNTSSKHKGICWYKITSKWVARINGKHLGYFKSEESAAREYDKAAIEIHGDFAKLNFPK